MTGEEELNILDAESISIIGNVGHFMLAKNRRNGNEEWGKIS